MSKLASQIENTLEKIHKNGPISQGDMEFLSLSKKHYPEIFENFESTIIYLLGLFYKTQAPKSILELVYSNFAKHIEEITQEKFTPIQADAYLNILEHRYFSFSAPTSSGKSFLFRKIIKETRGDIVVVIPSRALIAEYMDEINKIFWNQRNVLVLPFIENVNINNTSKRIYVITPERGDELFEIFAQLNIKLFLFDEAQLSEEEVRGLTFDAFVRRVDEIMPDAKKIFAHPFITNPEGQIQKHNFQGDASSKSYKQNAVGKIYMLHKEEHFEYFSPFGTDLELFLINESFDPIEDILSKKGTILIYTSKQQIYLSGHLEKFRKYIEMCEYLLDSRAIKIIEELGKFIGASNGDDGHGSFMIEMMRKGIVIHHGSMPLRARQLIENFVNLGFANICFATSTLIQGINMPFDCVWIDHFTFPGGEEKAKLDLKNLIGRSGRTLQGNSKFDFGYVIVNKKNVRTFKDRIIAPASISSVSLLDQLDDEIPEDQRDLVEGIRNNSIDIHLKLPLSQIQRIESANLDDSILVILNALFTSEGFISGEYYQYSLDDKTTVQKAFKKIFVSHLRRETLSIGETSVLSTAISILLWQIQGKSFKEIVGMRYAYLTNRKKINNAKVDFANGTLNELQYFEKLQELKTARSTPEASSLPNAKLVGFHGLYPKNTKTSSIDYDLIVYDTYDYLDKIIVQSLSKPIGAAFRLYYKKTQDFRALAMCNYLQYGTSDATEIWLLKYGFSFEEIEWVKPLLQSIDELGIVFNESIELLSGDERMRISKYI